MIHFQVLGALDLRRASGERIGSLLAHPKRVGIMLQLALAPSGKPLARAQLAARFWPDSPVARAQASLRTALSQMRQGMGPDTLEADGQQVWLNWRVLTCDAIQLQSAVDAGRWREAASLATGELAPGFELDEQVEFQRWLEMERERLRRTALTALRNRADEVDPAEADHLLVQASALAPFDGSLLRHRLELCERRGARAEAAALFQAWSARLRAELDLEPSPEVVAVFERVTGAPAVRISVPQATTAPTELVTPPPAPIPSGPEPQPPRARRLILRAAVIVLVLVAGAWAVFSPAAEHAPTRPADARALALIDAGMAQFWRDDENGALDSFLQAIEIDPEIPRAHYGLMLAAAGMNRRGPLEDAGRALERLRPRMTTAEARRADAHLAFPDAARTIYQELNAAEPDSLDVLFLLADLEFHWGSTWGVPREELRAKFERIEATGYAEVRALRHLTRIDAADADLDALRRRTERLEELDAPAFDILLARTLEAVLDSTATFAVGPVASLPAEQRTALVGAVAAVRTVPDRVDQFLAELHDAVPPSAKAELAIWNALAAAGRGRLERANQWLRTAAAAAPARADEFRAVIATLPWLPADAGRWDDAARTLQARRATRLISPFAADFLADAIYAPRALFLEYMTILPRTGAEPPMRFDQLEQRTVIDVALMERYRSILESRGLLIAEDDETRGLQALGPPAIAPDQLRPQLLHHPFAVERFLRVQALILAGRFEEARAFVRGAPDPSGYDRAYLAWALTLGGDVAVQLGDAEEARREYLRAADALRGADPEFQTLQNHIERQLEALGG